MLNGPQNEDVKFLLCLCIWRFSNNQLILGQFEAQNRQNSFLTKKN